MPPVTPPLEVSAEELEALLERAREALGETGYQKLKAAIHTLSYVTELLETREATLASLRRLLCRARSEKTDAVLEEAGIAPSSTPKRPAADTVRGKTAPGHGRNSATAYAGARHIAVVHTTLHRGDRCPECQARQSVPGPGAWIVSQVARAGADCRHHLPTPEAALQSVRRTVPPEGVGEDKYDATTASMISLLRYGSGFPWNRLTDLQESMGIPLPVATQCEIVAEAAAMLQPAMEELIRQAAQGGEVLHNDDTSMLVLAAPPEDIG